MSTPQLDGAELLHLAIEASGRNDHATAIIYLKQALDIPEGGHATSTDYAKYVYMLGAEYAQIGLMDRAAEHMTQAVCMDPTLYTARFQLALLHLSCNQPAQALAELTPLANLPEESPFKYLAEGLQHLIEDRFDQCKAALQRGMELNANSEHPNLALNGDMQKLISTIDEQLQSSSMKQDSTQQAAEAGFMMSAYNRGNTLN